MAGDRSLAVRRTEYQAELADASDEGHLSLELQLQPFGGVGRDGRDRHGEERGAGGPRRAAVPSFAILLLALLEQAGINALVGEFLVDGAGPLLLQDHSGDALEAVPDGEVAHGGRGRQRKAVGAFLDVGSVILEDLPHVHTGVAPGDADIDVHLAQGEHARVGTSGARGHQEARLGAQRCHGGGEEAEQEAQAWGHGQAPSSGSGRLRRASPSSVPM